MLLLIVVLDEPPPIVIDFPGSTPKSAPVINDPATEKHSSDYVEKMPMSDVVPGSDVETIPTNKRTLSDILIFSDNNKRLTSDQQTLGDIAKEIEVNAKRGIFISYEETLIFDSWADEYGVSQHHKAYRGSAKHYKMGWDHTHYFGKHVPFKIKYGD